MNTLYFISLLLSVTLSVGHGDFELFPKEFGEIEVQPHSVPFIVSLVFKTEERNVSFCAGSLINENWILTASHCLEHYPDIYVMAGHHSIDTSQSTTQIRKASAVYKHNQILGNASDCIGLIYVQNGFTLNQEVQSVVLGDINTATNDKIVVHGWGASLSSKLRIYPENLRSAHLSIVSAQKCKSTYPMEFDDTHNFCAIGLDRIVCVEQPGSPVFQNGVQVGIVLWRSDECDAKTELLISRVSSYNSWIQEQVLQSMQSAGDVTKPQTVQDDLIQVNVNLK